MTRLLQIYQPFTGSLENSTCKTLNESGFHFSTRRVAIDQIEKPNKPIDVVYTWVNGSDPLFLESLASLENDLAFKNITPEALLLWIKFPKNHPRVIRDRRIHFCYQILGRIYSRSYSNFSLQ